MDISNRKNIIKKLLRDELDETEQKALIETRQVTEYLRKQWDDLPDSVAADDKKASRIWKSVKHNTWERVSSKKILFYRTYSLVASIALLFCMAGSVYLWLDGKSTIMHVVSSGILNMQSVVLPDGTVVQMGAGSKLIYPGKFEGKTREVTLDGQAFFDVAKDRSKPFIVHASGMDVQALGTSFELFSYDIENKSEAILLNGKIKVKLPGVLKNGSSEFVLSPDEKIIFDKQRNDISKVKVDADKYTAWRKQKILSFENEKLSMIIPRLEQWYGRKIMCQRDLSEKYRFTFKVKDESLERILFMIEESSPMKYKKSENGDFSLDLKM